MKRMTITAASDGNMEIDKTSKSDAAEAIDPIDVALMSERELSPPARAAIAALLREVADLREQLSEARAKAAELETLASTDPLLGVLNRRAFVAELGRSIGMAQRYGQTASLVFIDLDHLKKINDLKGHAAGDVALTHTAQIIAENIRQTDIFGRLGGDEFGIIFTNTSRAVAEDKARVLSELVKAAPPDGLEVSITCGVIEIAADLTAEAALMAADNVMYEKKRRR